MPSGKMQKQAHPETGSGRLSATPTLSPDYVQGKLEEQVGAKLPPQIAQAILKTGNFQRLHRVAHTLKKIISSSGEFSEAAINRFSDSNLARLLVLHPGAFFMIARAAGGGTPDALAALSNRELSSAFAKNPAEIASSMMRIARTAGEAREGAFFLLSQEEVASAFARSPKTLTDAFARMGRHAQDAFSVLASKKASSAFAKEPTRISRAMRRIGKDAGGSAGAAFLALQRDAILREFLDNPTKIAAAFSLIGKGAGKGAREAFRLIGSDAAASAFLANPQKVADSIAKIGLAAGEASEEIFTALGCKEAASAFFRDPEAVTDALMKISNAAGDNAIHAFLLISQKSVASAFAKDVQGVSGAIVRMCEAAGDGAGFMLSFLSREDVAPDFAKDVQGLSGHIIEMCKAAGSEAANIFWVMNSENIATTFAENVEKLSGFFSAIKKAKGVKSEYAFAALGAAMGMKQFMQSLYSMPDATADAFVESARICGRKQKYLFSTVSSMVRRGVATDFFSEPGKLMKLSEASVYSSVLFNLEMFMKNGEGEKALRTLEMLDEPEKIAGRYAIPNLTAYRNKWGEGRRIARSAGITFEDREVFINFAYAAGTIGQEKAIAIYNEYGIEYFARYGKETLEGLYEHIGEEADSRPVFLVISSKYDYTGSLYFGSRERHTNLWKDGYYNVVFAEAEKEREVYGKIGKFGDKYFGISRFQVSAHGTARSIILGPGTSEENLLDLSDYEELSALANMFAEEPLIILDSCSSGEDRALIASAISEALGAELVAPQGPTSIKRYLRDDEGNVTGAVYKKEKSGAVFRKGVKSK